MSPISVAFPTAQQLDSLSRTAAQQSRATASCPASLLHRCLSLLQTPWVSSFLFTSSPIHIRHFSNPCPALPSLTSTLSATRVEPFPFAHPRPSNEPETHHMHCRQLLSPAFTLHHLTAGFGVLRAETHNLSPHTPELWHLACAQTMHFRFVHDAASHTSMHLIDAPHLALVLLDVSTFLSSTRIRTVTFVLRRPALHAAVAVSGGDCAPSAEDLLSALWITYHDEQTFPCKVCHAPADARCGCKLPTYTARHPYDSEHFQLSVGLFLGTHDGMGIKKFGICERKVTLATRIAMHADTDPAFARDATDWVVSSFLNSTPPSPSRSRLFFMYDPSMWLEKRRHAAKTLQDLDAELLRTCGILDRNVDTEGEDVCDARSETLIQVSKDHQLDRYLMSCDPTRTVEAEVAASGACPLEDFAVLEDASAVGKSGPSKFVERTVLEGEEWWERRCESGKNGTGEEAEVVVPAPRAKITTSDTTEIASSSSLPVHTPTPIDIPTSFVVMTNRSKEEERDFAERRRKAIARRERNRLAARKSNLRRKEKRESLVAAVKSMNDHKEELRKKEMVLRKENMRLRKMAIGSN